MEHIGELSSLVNIFFDKPEENVSIFQNIPEEFHKNAEELQSFTEIVWLEICSVIRNEIVPEFWSNFYIDSKTLTGLSEPNNTPAYIELQYELFKRFVIAVEKLNIYYISLLQLIERIQNAQTKCKQISLKSFREFLGEALLGQLPAQFNHIVYGFYYVSLKVFTYGNHNNSELINDLEITVLSDVICNGCGQEMNKCNCEYLKILINETNERLQCMELLDGISGHALTFLVQQRIKEYVSDTCHGIFEKSFLKQLESWLDSVVISWLKRIFNHGNPNLENNAKTNDIIHRFKVKLTYFLYENYAKSIIEQFFSIIIDFPESIPVIDDLKICMEKIDMRKHLIYTLKNSLKGRILHPGVNTIDILTGYVAAIKAIRHLDSTGIILETVTSPIKEYLRKRNDTVRRVVTGLTEEGPTDLSEELAKGEILKEKAGSAVADELSNWENWMPDPFGLDSINRPQPVNKSRSADIISMVVDIYGSKELFMNEYRNLMADRLLSQLDFNADKEIRNLELLKLRFGENVLHSCEVMLKDVADSKRINAHIHSDTQYSENNLFDISSLIISAQFWPSFNKESLELPEEIANEFNKYTKSYETYKGNRTLNWRTVTGRVNILIEIGGRNIEMTVTPTQAVIIYHFQNKDEWALDDLSHLIKVPPTVLRRRIGFWQTHGLVNEIRENVFKLIEENIPESQFNQRRSNQFVSADEDIESAMASASDQREEELQVFWSYIVGMLTNLDSLPLERIHQMLKLFASHGVGVKFTQEELKDFLQRKVREHKLIFSGGVYQLSK